MLFRSAPVAWLPRDPGLIMADGGCWAEALAAWRQPTLLVVSPLQLGTGFPAACTALLQRCSVPLLGLIQWGDGWRESERRADRLPWLGSLSNRASVEAEDREDEDRLITLLRWRWQRLDVQGGA